MTVYNLPKMEQNQTEVSMNGSSQASKITSWVLSVKRIHVGEATTGAFPKSIKQLTKNTVEPKHTTGIWFCEPSRRLWSDFYHYLETSTRLSFVVQFLFLLFLTFLDFNVFSKNVIIFKKLNVKKIEFQKILKFLKKFLDRL